MSKRLRRSVWCACSSVVFAVLWLVVGALGCSPAPSYVAMVDRVPVKFRSAFAVSTGGAALRLMLTNKLTSCDQVRARVFGCGVPAASYAEDMEMLLAPTFENDGTRTWKVSNISYDNKFWGTGPYDVDAPAVDPIGVVRVTVKQPLVLNAGSPAPKDALIEWPTEIRALGCGVAPRPADARPRPQPLLTAKVNGAKVSIQGAVLTKLERNKLLGVYGLVLSSGPITCTDTLEGDVVIEVDLDVKGTGVTYVFLEGAATFLRDHGGTTYELGAKPHGDIAGTGDVSIDLAGKASLPGKDLHHRFFEVELAGTVNALRCP